jgi:hypothetical protein
MKIIKVAWFIAAALISLNGCSSYQLAGGTKEVIVDKTSPDTIKVTFCGNAYMSQAEVEKYALQRAAEAAMAKGCPYFVVLDKNDQSEMCMLNSKDIYGSPASPEKQESSSYDFQPFVRPNVALTIRCIGKDEKVPEGAIDAKQFMREKFPGLLK